MASDKLVDFDHVTDYISREAAIEVAKAHYPKANEMIAGIILIPTADVRPVVRGKWVRGNENRTSPIKDSYICSVCGEKTLSGFCGNPAKTNFCPNCGADMRPDKNDQRGEQQWRENRKTLR